MWEGIDTSWAPEFETIIPKIINWYNADNGTLILSGGYGCGKTHIAKRILAAAGGPAPVLEWDGGQPESVRNAILYPEPKLLEDIRESYKFGSEGKIVRECKTAKLLIIDDLGAAYIKEGSERWYQDLLWRIVDTRIERKNLITTNLNPAQLKDRVGGRVWSRFQQMLGDISPHQNIINMFNIKDYRQRPR